MRYLILIFLISLNSYAINWNFKYSGFTEIKKLNFNSNDEAINFNNYGTWEDSLGNYGEGKCQGMSTIEDNQNDMKFYCEYTDQDNDKMIGKGIRKSDINAGVGKMIMIDGEGKWKKMIGAECDYAIKYKGRVFFAAQKCKKNK
tara:strand:+ start:2271 stop:2702 length:432 start_codon:yes stop_codon:yes gene_type:complete